MGIEVRRLEEPDEFDEYARAAIYSFNAPRDEAQLQRYRDLYDFDWCLGCIPRATGWSRA